MSAPVLGEIRPFTFQPYYGSNSGPTWVPCDGRTLQIQQFKGLYSLIGITYGGNGTTTFAIPDLRGRTPIGVGQDSFGNIYTLGQQGGAETVALALNQMPAHNHMVSIQTTTGTIGVVDFVLKTVVNSVELARIPYSCGPVVTDISPVFGSGAGGTTVTINGNNFGPSSTVLFGTTSLTPAQTPTLTQIIVTSPVGTRVVPVYVVNQGQQSASGDSLPQFSYAPILLDVEPQVGPADGSIPVTLTGNNFTNDSVVKFVAATNPQATITSLTDSTITVTPPANPVGTQAYVSVTTQGGVSDWYLYTYCSVGVTQIQPQAGPAGTAVTISGFGFAVNSVVSFGGTAATDVSVNAAGTTITCTAPSGTGQVNVTVTTNSVVSPISGDSFYSFAPILSTITPSQGTLPLDVTITGQGFIAQGSFGGQMKVYIGGEPAVQAIESTTTSVTVGTMFLPGGAAPVTITTPGGTGSGLTFTVVPSVTSKSFGSSAQNTLNLLTLSSTGGAPAAPHENRQPFLALNYFICVNGQFPFPPSAKAGNE